MIAGIAREHRSARSKAREVSRKLTRIHRSAREELSKAEDWTLLLLGGVAVLGGGYLAYQALTKPAVAATPGSAPSPSPGPSPSPSPSPPPSSGVSWSASALPWAPPSNPAALPPGFSLTDDLTTQDPMWVAMAQSALNIFTRAGFGPVAISYATAPNGIVDTGFMIALAQVQGYIATSNAQVKAVTPGVNLTNPHTNGILDLKTLAFLISMSASIAVSTGTAIVSTSVTDPILSQEALFGLNTIVSTTGSIYTALSSSLPTSITPGTLSAALSQFQTNWNLSKTALIIQVTGTLDWITWGMIETFAG